MLTDRLMGEDRGVAYKRGKSIKKKGKEKQAVKKHVVYCDVFVFVKIRRSVRQGIGCHVNKRGVTAQSIRDDTFSKLSRVMTTRFGQAAPRGNTDRAETGCTK